MNSTPTNSTNNDFLYLVCKDDDPKNWKYQSLSQIQKHFAQNGKGVFLVFGGNGSNNYKSVIGYGKLVKSLLGSYKDNANIIVANYNSITNYSHDIAANIQEFVDTCIAPLAYQKYHKDVDSCAKHFRKITILGHCFGAYGIINGLENILHDTMLRMQYTEQETAFLLSQIVCITYGAKTNLKYVSEFNIMSLTDNVKKKDSNALWRELLENIDTVDMTPKDKSTLLKAYIKSKRKYDKILAYNDKVYNTKGLEYNDYELLLKKPVINLKRITRYLKHKDRVYLAIKNSHKALIASSHLSKFNNTPEESGDDHLLSYAHFEDNFRPDYTATTSGQYIARTISTICCHSVANTLINLRQNDFVPFPFAQTCQSITQFVSPLNYKQHLHLPNNQLFNIDQQDIQPHSNHTNHPHSPLFVNQDEKIRIDTRTGEYLDRVK